MGCFPRTDPRTTAQCTRPPPWPPCSTSWGTPPAWRSCATSTELTEHLGLAQSTVSQHLAILRSAGLISSHSHGRANVSRIEHPEDIEKVLAAAESLAAIISAAPSGQDQEPL